MGAGWRALSLRIHRRPEAPRVAALARRLLAEPHQKPRVVRLAVDALELHPPRWRPHRRDGQRHRRPGVFDRDPQAFALAAKHQLPALGQGLVRPAVGVPFEGYGHAAEHDRGTQQRERESRIQAGSDIRGRPLFPLPFASAHTPPASASAGSARAALTAGATADSTQAPTPKANTATVVPAVNTNQSSGLNGKAGSRVRAT